MIIDKENSFILKTPEELNKINFDEFGPLSDPPYPEGGESYLNI